MNKVIVSSDELLKKCVNKDFNGSWKKFKTFLQDQSNTIIFHPQTRQQIKLDLIRVNELMKENK